MRAVTERIKPVLLKDKNNVGQNLKKALANTGINYVTRYTNHLPLIQRLSVLEAAKQASLSPDPIKISDFVSVKIAKIDSRPLASLAYIQKFRTFASKYCSTFNEEQPLVVHTELCTRFSRLPLDSFLSHGDSSIILQFLLQGCCPTIFTTKSLGIPLEHDNEEIVKAVKRLRAVLHVSERQACRQCPQRGSCRWTMQGMTASPRLVYLIRMLSGMHITCLNYLKAPEVRLRYNQFEMQGYMRLIDALDQTIEESFTEMIIKKPKKLKLHPPIEIKKIELTIKRKRKFEDLRKKQQEALNIPSWMRPSIDPVDERLLGRKQRNLLRRFRQLQEEESTPEGFVDETTGRITVDETTRKAGLELRSTSLIQSIRRRKKVSKQEVDDADFVWIPEPDPSKTEFGEPTSFTRWKSNRVEDSKLDNHNSNKISENRKKLQIPEDTSQRIIIDIDDESNTTEGTYNETENAGGQEQVLERRFNYLMDFRADVNGASSVQQALYQNYLKAIKASVQIANPEKVYNLGNDEIDNSINENNSLIEVVDTLNQPTQFDQGVAESCLELRPLQCQGYSVLETNRRPLHVRQNVSIQLQIEDNRYSLDPKHSKLYKKKKALIARIWEQVDKNTNLDFIKKFELDYPRQTSSGSQPPLRKWKNSQETVQKIQSRNIETAESSVFRNSNLVPSDKESPREKVFNQAFQNKTSNELPLFSNVNAQNHYKLPEKKVDIRESNQEEQLGYNKTKRLGKIVEHPSQVDREISLEDLAEVDAALQMNQNSQSKFDMSEENENTQTMIVENFPEPDSPSSIEVLQKEGIDVRQNFAQVRVICSADYQQNTSDRINRKQRKSICHSKSQLLDSDLINDSLFEQWKTLRGKASLYGSEISSNLPNGKLNNDALSQRVNCKPELEHVRTGTENKSHRNKEDIIREEQQLKNPDQTAQTISNSTRRTANDISYTTPFIKRKDSGIENLFRRSLDNQTRNNKVPQKRIGHLLELNVPVYAQNEGSKKVYPLVTTTNRSPISPPVHHENTFSLKNKNQIFSKPDDAPTTRSDSLNIPLKEIVESSSNAKRKSLQRLTEEQISEQISSISNFLS